METIKKGDLAKPKEPNWTGQTLECPKCDGQFKLRATDRPAAAALSPDGATRFYCPTPGCGTLIAVKESDK